MRTLEEQILLGDVALAIERPAEPEALLDEERFAEDEYLPYWAELWPSALDLARHVSSLPLAGVRTLELGCGLAVPGLVAASRGAIVTAADWSPEAIGLLARNARRNHLDCRGVVMDWRDPAPLGNAIFDLVLASDVLYEERNIQPLLRLLSRVTGPGGAAFVADPGRRHADGFAVTARAAGFAVDAVSLESRSAPRGWVLRLWSDRDATGTARD